MKTIDVHAKEWFDKLNGNSYFAATIIINIGLSSEKTIKIPFTYGDGDYYLTSAFDVLKAFGMLKDADTHWCLWKYCNDKGIILRYSKQKNCLKRELKNI